MTTIFITPKKPGILIVFGLLLSIGGLQILFLIRQFNAAPLSTEFLLVSEPFFVLLISLGLLILILIEINQLQEFHFDNFTVTTFLLSLLLGSAAGLTGTLCSPIMGGVGIVMLIIFFMKKPIIPKTNMRFTMIAILLGSVSVAVLTLLEIYIRPAWFTSEFLQRPVVPTVVGVILRQFSVVSLEEILFRGFLWGYLRQSGWEENRVMWTQGLLFWLLHISKLFITPFTFLISVPVLTLISSKLTLDSKQVFPSIISHTIMNTVGVLLNLATF